MPLKATHIHMQKITKIVLVTGLKNALVTQSILCLILLMCVASGTGSKKNNLQFMILTYL